MQFMKNRTWIQIIIIVVGILIVSTVFSISEDSKKGWELVKKFDNLQYRPELAGVKDLTVDIEIPLISRQLNEKVIFGKLDKVYFKLYWIDKGLVDVVIFGLPEGFFEIKRELKYMIMARFDLILPPSLEKVLAGYSLQLSNDKGGHIVIGQDLSYLKMIRRYKLFFSRVGLVVELDATGGGDEKSTLEYFQPEWSKGKWVVQKILVTAKEAGSQGEVKSTIKYKKVDGFGFPVMMNSQTKQTLLQPLKNRRKNKDKYYKRDFSSVVLFKNYKINRGLAQKWFRKHKGLKR